MEAIDTIFEFVSSVFFLILGTWATIYSYGLVGDRLIGQHRWNENSKKYLRWLGPLVVALSIACIVFGLLDISKMSKG
jgi:hypothetical protein